MSVQKVRFCLECGILIGKYGKSNLCSSCLRKQTWAKHKAEGYKPKNNTKWGLTRKESLVKNRKEILEMLGI
jgi:hypothetical protein